MHLFNTRIRAVQTRPEPDDPAKLPKDNSISARTEGPVGRRRVSVLKNRHRQVEWRVRISKTRATRTDRSYKKIRLNPAKTSQIRQDLDQIRLYLVGFSQIWPNPTISSEKKMHISEKIQFSIRIFQFPAKFSSFWQKFPISGENSRFRRRLFFLFIYFRFRCLF